MRLADIQTIDALGGACMLAPPGCLTRAYNRSYVIAPRGAIVVAGDGAAVDAEAGSLTIAGAKSVVFASPGARVIALKGSQIWMEPGADVVAYPGAHVDPWEPRTKRHPGTSKKNLIACLLLACLFLVSIVSIDLAGSSIVGIVAASILALTLLTGVVWTMHRFVLALKRPVPATESTFVRVSEAPDLREILKQELSVMSFSNRQGTPRKDDTSGSSRQRTPLYLVSKPS